MKIIIYTYLQGVSNKFGHASRVRSAFQNKETSSNKHISGNGF